jgi:hypothetical protein
VGLEARGHVEGVQDGVQEVRVVDPVGHGLGECLPDPGEEGAV